jgi:endonuclease G, mitochondrial
MLCRLYTIALILAVSLAMSPVAFAGRTACPEHYAGGSAPDFVNMKLAAKTREICYEGYGAMHSAMSRTPLWSAEYLTRLRLTKAKGLPRVNDFHPERQLPAFERAELRDYARSGFDRGHLAPSADMPSPSAQLESFSLANIIPQDSGNNRSLWAAIESVVRKETRQRGRLYVVTGPLFIGDTLKSLKGRVLIPSHIFKAVYDPGRKEAAVYLVTNESVDSYQVISVKELRSIAGIDVFPHVPEQIKGRVMKLPKPARHRDRVEPKRVNARL